MNVIFHEMRCKARTAAFLLAVFAIPYGTFAANGGEIEAGRARNAYFQAETKKLQDRCLADIETADQWERGRPEYRRQLLEMLGLDPFPEKTPLRAAVMGTTDHNDFTVENLHFQSMPRLYVTANLYIPKGLSQPAPAILYVCGHGPVKKDGVSYGNKVRYQHHAGWFARHGYVCLIIDTLQLGEIEGIHHGTYRYKMWWWNSRGYCPAGVEAWNCIRSLDYLQTRSEVDPDRLGVTGRSGGGAYSWWIAALDERIQAAVPVAGITDLQNHVVTGCVEGHCDCMYIVNTYRWDYPMVAALVAPRPLLISNTDKDGIFPLDGVVRVHERVREVYRLYDAEKNLGLHITEGPHKDTQELRVHAFVWFNRFLKGENPLITTPAVALLEPEQLKVFQELPGDELNTKIHETFVPEARKPAVPESQEQWATMRDGWMQALREKVFRAWPDTSAAGPLDVRRAFAAESDGMSLEAFDFTSQPNVRLRLFLLRRTNRPRPTQVTLNVLDESGWRNWLAAMRVRFETCLSEYELPDSNAAAFHRVREELGTGAVAYLAPRGIGPTAWSGDERTHTHIRRRFMLLGQTLDGMRVWDVRRGIEVIKQMKETENAAITLHARGNTAALVLYASLFEPGIARLELTDLPPTHRDGPIFLNVQRYMDMPQAVAMVAEKSDVTLRTADASPWQFPVSVAEKLNWRRWAVRLDAGSDSSR